MRSIGIAAGVALVAACTLTPAIGAQAADSVTVNGTVTAGNHTPVRTLVNWYQPSTGKFGDPVPSSADTGAYSLPIPADLKNYVLTYNLETFQNRADDNWTGEFVGQGASPSLAWENVSLIPSASARTVDVTLETPGQISGHVAGDDPQSQPVYLESLDGYDIVYTQSEPDGSYSFSHLVPGDYQIYYPGKNRNYVSPRIDVQPGSSMTQDVTPPVGASVTGTVSYHGKPVANATVTISDSDGYVDVLHLGATSHFSSDGLAPGKITVRVSAPGHPATTSNVTVADGKRTDIPVNLLAGGTAVVRFAGHAGKSAQVSIVGKSFSATKSVHSAKAGSTSFSGLPVGSYAVTVREAGASVYGTATVHVTADHSSKTSTLKFTHKTVSLTVRVAASAAGQVSVRDAHTNITTEATLKAGTAVVRNQVPGTMYVTVRANGYTAKTTHVSVTKTQTTAFARGSKYGSVKGQIPWSGQDPNFEAWLVNESDPSDVENLDVSADGTVTGDVPPGTYTFHLLGSYDGSAFQYNAPFYLARTLEHITVASNKVTDLSQIAAFVEGQHLD